MKNKTPLRKRISAAGPQAQRLRNVTEIAEILAILARSPAGDHLSIACFLTNATTRLNDLSPLEALAKGDEKLTAVVKQLALENLE